MCKIGEMPGKSESAQIEFDKVKLLFDYTKFHILLYTTLAALLLAVADLENVKPEIHAGLIWSAILSIGIAGLAGGIIASSLPHENALSEFWTRKTGPFGLEILQGKYWTFVEHTAFWVGLGFAVAGFI